MSTGALPATFFARSSLDVAPELLDAVLSYRGCSVRIVEVEAYLGEHDPASHAFGGRTRRNASMFGPPGTLYVYFTYGIHWCANVVCGREGEASAVLLRAAEPLTGLAAMRRRRTAARRDRDLCNGPAKLCQALGIDGDRDGEVLGHPSAPRLVRGVSPAAPPHLTRGPRVGVTAGRDLPWRWWVADDPHVSR